MAAGGITAAAVWVDVIPSMAGAAKRISKDARQLGQETGKNIAEETARSIAQRAAAIGSAISRTFTRVQQAAVTAGQRIGRAFSGGIDAARAALGRFMTGWSALDAETARAAGRLGRFGAAARSAFDTAARPLHNFIGGFSSAEAAASALTGRLGTLGGQARRAFDVATRPLKDFVAGFRSADAAASAFTGRMGSLGGATRSALNTAAAPLQNFVSGFRSSEAAASAFTGRMGTLGGATRNALTSAAQPLNNFVAGFRSSEAAASAFSGRMGTLGGVVRSAVTGAGTAAQTAFGAAMQPLHNFRAGFSSSAAAASAFSGRMGSLGGVVRSALGGIGPAVDGMAARFSTAASSIGQRLRAGIEAPLGSIAAQASGLVAAIGLGGLGTAALMAAANIQNTELTLTGLYQSAEKAGDMMGRLKNLSENSPIDYAAYARASTQLAYMGFEGAQAEQILKNVGAAIVAVGGDSSAMDRATSAMLGMINSGKVYAAQLTQISDAGVPIWSALSDRFFQTTDRIGEVREMVTKGAVSIEDVMAAIENGSGATFQNMLSAAENVTGSMSNQFRVLRDKVITGFGLMMAPLTSEIAPKLGGIGQAIEDGMARVPALLGQLRGIMDATGITAALESIGTNARNLASGALPILKGMLIGLGATFGGIILALEPVFGLLGQLGLWMSENATIVQYFGVTLGSLAAVFIASRVAIGAASMAMTLLGPSIKGATLLISGLKLAYSGASAVVSGVMTVLRSAWLKSAAVATWSGIKMAAAWLLAMGPVGWVITIIGALVAAAIFAWNHFEGFRNVVTAVWEAIKDGAAAAWSFLQGVWTGLTDGVSSVIDWFAALPAAISGFFSAVGDFFTALPGQAMAGMSAMGTAVGDFLTNLPSMIAYGLGAAVGAIIRWGADVYVAVVSGFYATLDFLAALPSRVAGFLIQLGATLYAGAVDTWDRFTTGLETAWDATVDFFVALPGRVAAFMAGVGVMLYGAAVIAWAKFTAGVETAWDATVAWFVALPARVAAFVIGIGVALAAAAVTAWNGFTSGVERGWLETLAFLVSLPSRIKGFFSSAASWLMSTGVDLIAGLLVGIASAWAGFTTWVGGLIDSFIAGFKDGLGVASPSTIFAEIGGWLIQGLINGLRAAGALLWSAITAIANGVVNFFMAGIAMLQERWNAVWYGISSAFSMVWNTIRNVASTVWGWIVSYFQTSLAAYQVMWSTIWGAVSSFFTGIWNWIKTTALGVWAAISAYFQTSLAAYRAMWSTIWNAISAVFTTVWNWIKTTATNVWNGIVAFFTNAFAAFTSFFTNVWNNILAFFRNIWNWLRDTAVSVWNWLSFWFQVALVAYQTMWSNIWNAILSFFRNIWTWLRDTAVNAWNAIRTWFDNAFAAFTTFFRDTWNNIVDTFSRIWSGITDIARNVWERVKSTFKDGVNGVIRLINRFADGINKVAGMLGFTINLHVPELADGGPITSASAGRAGTSLARARQTGGPIALASGGGVNAAAGGMLPGRQKPGRDRLPALAGGTQPYLLDGGEYVVQRDSTRAIGAAGMAAINNARRQPVDIMPRRGSSREALYGAGGAIRLATGGQLGAAAQRAVPGTRITSTHRPGARGYHGSNQAADLAGPRPMDTPFMHRINKWIAATHGATTSELIFTPGINLRNGRSHNYNAATRADHHDHVHWAMAGPLTGGSGPAGEGGDGWFQTLMRPIAEGLLKPLRDVIVPIRDDAANGFGKRMVAGSGVNVIDKLLDLVAAMDAAGGAMDVSGISGPVVDQVRQVAARFGWDQGPEWAAIMDLVNRESSWNPAAANSRSSARGLFQKMTSLHGPVEPTPAGQAAWGLNYIKGRYQTPTRAIAFHNRNGHYDAGGVAYGKGILFKDVVAPERVLPPRETQSYETLTRLSQRLDAGVLRVRMDDSSADVEASTARDDRPVIENLYVTAPDRSTPEELAQAVTWEVRRVRRGGVYAR